jgi:agmatine deiminase
MEGGGINVDGEGTVLATRQNVMNDNRNPGLGEEEATRHLCDALGTEKVIWLPGDPEDTETDGHVDGIACFVAPGTVLVEICPATGTERYDNMQANLDVVRGQHDASGRELTVVTIEEAHEAERYGDIFASSYINFYIANDAALIPAFGIDRDEQARDTIKTLFPDREIVSIEISDIALGGGGIHCITQQQPKC